MREEFSELESQDVSKALLLLTVDQELILVKRRSRRQSVIHRRSLGDFHAVSIDFDLRVPRSVWTSGGLCEDGVEAGWRGSEGRVVVVDDMLLAQRRLSQKKNANILALEVSRPHVTDAFAELILCSKINIKGSIVQVSIDFKI